MIISEEKERKIRKPGRGWRRCGGGRRGSKKKVERNSFAESGGGGGGARGGGVRRCHVACGKISKFDGAEGKIESDVCGEEGRRDQVESIEDGDYPKKKRHEVPRSSYKSSGWPTNRMGDLS